MSRFYTMTVESTVSQNSVDQVFSVQVPQPGFALVRFKPIVYLTGNASPSGIITSSTTAQEEILVSIANQNGGVTYTQGSVSIWSLEDMEQISSPFAPWMGMYWPGGHQLQFEFQRTNKITLHTQDYHILLEMQGYIQYYDSSRPETRHPADQTF